MSHAIRCDRCGEYFSPLAQKEEFGHINEYFTRNGESMRNNEVLYRDDGIDFCPECTKAFGKMLFESRIFNRAVRDTEIYDILINEHFRLLNDHIQLNKIKEKAEEIRRALGYADENSIEKMVWYPPTTLRREFIEPLLECILDDVGIYGGSGDSGESGKPGICPGEPAERESDAESESNG